MPPPTLLLMATRMAIKNADAVTNIGDLSWELAEPILKKITNPKQLHAVETESPHIADRTVELWKAFIARDFPDAKVEEPEDPRQWFRVYGNLWTAHKKKMRKEEAALKQQLNTVGTKKADRTVEFVNQILPEPMVLTKYVDGNRRVPKARLPRVRKPTVQNAQNGKELLGAIRRESAKASAAKGLTRKTKMNQWNLQNPKAQITQPPSHMVRNRPPPNQDPYLLKMAAEWKAQQPSQLVNQKSWASPRSRIRRHEKLVNEAIVKDQYEKAIQIQARERANAKPTPSTSSTQQTVPQRHRPTPTKPSSEEAKTTTSSPSPSADSSAEASSPVSPKPAESKSPQPSTPDLAAPSNSGEKEAASPGPAPKIIKRRPAPGSVFMPVKRRRI